MTAPIRIGDRAWVTADVFVAPGVTIGDGVVVLARASVLSDLPPWSIVEGNPAMAKKARILKSPFGENG